MTAKFFIALLGLATALAACWITASGNPLWALILVVFLVEAV